MRNVLAQIHYMPDSWKGNAHTYKVRDEFAQLFQYKIVSHLSISKFLFALIQNFEKKGYKQKFKKRFFLYTKYNPEIYIYIIMLCCINCLSVFVMGSISFPNS